MEASAVCEVADAIRKAISTVVSGKSEAIDLAITALLSGTHLLIEDVPGVGKTTLAKALARSIKASVSRIQFTPDLLPSDITGVSIYNQHAGQFEFRPGGVFANIVIADEINRASPKTQSALLEAMEEHRVSVDGKTYPLPEPFLVVATQNPIEMEGTYPLPESQRDRFGMCISMGYPAFDSEMAILDAQGTTDPLINLRAVTDAAAIAAAIATTHHIWVDPAIKRYLLRIVETTRNCSELRVGASPRASLQLLRLARAYALVKGREYVIPDDIQALAAPSLGHRVLLNTQAQLERKPATEVIEWVLTQVPAPGRRE